MALNDECILISSPKRTKPLPSTSYTSISIETPLKNNKDAYRTVNNPSKRLTTICWTLFGFPARVTDENEFGIIPGFASRKQYFKTRVYS